MLKKTLLFFILFSTLILYANEINKNSSPVSSLYHNEFDNIMIVGFTKDVTQPNPTDWIGIYPKGSNNDWNNVIEWRWAKDSIPSGYQQQEERDKRYISLDISKYQDHTLYEARYFINNSFETYKKSNPFTIILEPLKISNMSAFSALGVTTIHIQGETGYPRVNPKDWIGIYKTETSNEWKNVIAWIWAKDIKTPEEEETCTTKFARLITPILSLNTDYEIRYFLNNSFVTYKSSPITVR